MTCFFHNSGDDQDGDLSDDDTMINTQVASPKLKTKKKLKHQPAKKPRQLPAKNKTEVTRNNPVCPDCKKKFLKIKILEVHYRKRHNESAMPNTCRHCKKGYFTAPGLEMHVVKFHEDEESDDMAESESDSDDDELSSEEEVTYVRLEKKSTQKTSFKSSKALAPVKTKSTHHIFRCMHCPMAFFEKSAFDKHKSKKHRNEEHNVVTDAKKNKNLLKKMTDEQRKKYEALLDEVGMSDDDEMESSTILLCPDCDKYFRKRSDLEAHKKNEHDVNNKSQDVHNKSQDVHNKSQDVNNKSQDVNNKSQDVNNKSQDVNNKSQDVNNGRDCLDISRSTSPSTISEVSDVPEQKEKPVESGSNCPVCGKSFKNNCGLSSHVRFVHPHYKKSSSGTSASSPSYKTPVAVSQTNVAISLTSRIGSVEPGQNATSITNETGEDATLCYVCGYQSQTLAGMEQHINKIHGQEQLPYRCGICSKGFLKPERVTSHAKCVHNTKVNVVQLQTISPPPSDCEEVTGSRTVALPKEVVQQSTNVSQISHSMNNTEVSQTVNQEDIVFGESKVQQDFAKGRVDLAICPDCGKNCSSRKLMEVHYRSVHSELSMPHQCRLCVRGFFEQSSLDYHLKRSHKNYDFSNTISPRSVADKRKATSPVSQQKMKKSKTVKDSLQCPSCKISFETPAYLEEHFRSRHPGHPMSYKCMTCLQGYFDAGRLRWHCGNVHGIKVSAEQLHQMKTEEEMDEGVADNDVDSYTSDHDDYQSSVVRKQAEPVHDDDGDDDDGDSYTSDQEASASADILRGSVIDRILRQPAPLPDAGHSTSSSAIQTHSHGQTLQSRAMPLSSQSYGNVIVIEPEPTSSPIISHTTRHVVPPSGVKVAPSNVGKQSSYNVSHLKPTTKADLRARAEYVCPVCNKACSSQQHFERHIKEIHASTLVKLQMSCMQ